MLPIGGKFRVIDFTIRNSFSSGARSTVIYNNIDDGLEHYVDCYGPFGDMTFPPIKVISREFSDMTFCYNVILDANTQFYIIYNGDNPSIIDFKGIIKKYKKRRSDAVLFSMNIDGKPSMAYKVLVTNQKILLKVVNKAIDEDRKSPNIFEMIINTMINDGIKTGTFDAMYWPVKNIPDYDSLNRKIIWSPEIFGLLYEEKLIQSQIIADGYAHIGPHGQIINSFMSDYCEINGKVENSIIYPGVIIGEGSVVKNSILLPFVRIGKNSRIYNSVIDEKTEFSEELEYNTIGDNCVIGTEDLHIKSNDFPRFLFESKTIIGKNAIIPDGARIGGGCYVASGAGQDYFEKKKFLYDKESIKK